MFQIKSHPTKICFKEIPKLKNNFYHKTVGIIKDVGLFFLKVQIHFEIMIYSFFSFCFDNKPWGSKSSAAGVKIECCLGSKLSTSTQSQCLCGCTQFWPLVHSILTAGSTLFWPPATLNFDPQGLFSKQEFGFFFKAISLIIFLGFYGKQIFFDLGIPLRQLIM